MKYRLCEIDSGTFSDLDVGGERERQKAKGSNLAERRRIEEERLKKMGLAQVKPLGRKQ